MFCTLMFILFSCSTSLYVLEMNTWFSNLILQIISSEPAASEE